MSDATSSHRYGWTLIFIGSLMVVVGVFGEPETDLAPLIGLAIACALAGFGLLRAWAWAKWLAVAWGPLAVIVGAVVLSITNRPVSIPEYAVGAAFAIAWVWDAYRPLNPERTRDEAARR